MGSFYGIVKDDAGTPHLVLYQSEMEVGLRRGCYNFPLSNEDINLLKREVDPLEWIS